jgi:hypothetical protein
MVEVLSFVRRRTIGRGADVFVFNLGWIGLVLKDLCFRRCVNTGNKKVNEKYNLAGFLSFQGNIFADIASAAGAYILRAGCEKDGLLRKRSQ